MKRPMRLTLAFLWLTLGYWIFGFLLQFALVLLPFARSQSGISTHSSGGVHTVHFSCTPGDAILILVAEGGDQSVKFSSTHSSQTTVSANGYQYLLLTMLFALVSLPILSRLFRRDC